MAWSTRLSGSWFNLIHGNNLIYNTCWEDPRLDRVALEIGPDDEILVITSAGCNVLDYLLDRPRHIYAVDVNPRQNALLELKLAGIRALEFDEFFALFGRGVHPDCKNVYASSLREQLSPSARHFWDRRITFFSGRGRGSSFYFRGTAGLFAHLINIYIDRIAKLRNAIEALLGSASVEEQQEIYYGKVRDEFWTGFIRWALGQDASMSLLGVPAPQTHQIKRHYGHGVGQFIEDCLEAVFALLPIHDNYFWRVYLTGRYTRECCPEYLREQNFHRLKAGLVDRVSVHTRTIEDFLVHHEGPISRFVLLDHMDWLSTVNQHALRDEWQAIVNKATPRARLIWRSGGLHVDFVDPQLVEVGGTQTRVSDLLTYKRELAEELHARDRVHTYGSFQIADMVTA